MKQAILFVVWAMSWVTCTVVVLHVFGINDTYYCMFLGGISWMLSDAIYDYVDARWIA